MQSSLHCSVENMYLTFYSTTIYTAHCFYISTFCYTHQHSIRIRIAGMQPHGVALVSRERLERPYGMRFWIANSSDQERQCSTVQCRNPQLADLGLVNVCERMRIRTAPYIKTNLLCHIHASWSVYSAPQCTGTEQYATLILLARCPQG